MSLGLSLCLVAMILLLIAVLAGPFIYFTVKNVRAQREVARAIEGECLLCESRELAEREDGSYRCGECGFDSRWKNTPELSELVDHLRLLREARDHFEEAAAEMESAERWSLFDIFWGSGGGKRGAMQKAGRAQVNGLTTLKDLVGEHPELLEMPVAGETVTASVLSDVGLDFIGTDIEMHGQIKESREQVEQYLEGVSAVEDAVVERIYERCDAAPVGSGSP